MRGNNYFDVENEIPEVAVSVDWGPGTPGHPVNGIYRHYQGCQGHLTLLILVL